MDPVGHYDHPVRRMLHEGRQFLALYRQRGCVPFRRKRKGHKMNDYVVIIYNGEQVSVPKEVADFLEQDRKRQQAQDKQDARHLSKSEFETVLSGLECVKRPVEGDLLADDGGDRSDLRHLQNGGIKATEKAARKAGKLCLMTGLPSFFEKFSVFRFTNAR